MIKIKALINLSESCEQSINHTCTVNPLTKYASWIDRHGIVNNYWFGSKNATVTDS